MDGVLADTSQFHYRAWEQIFKARGVNLSWEEFTHFFGMRDDKIIPMVIRGSYTKEEIIKISDEKEFLFRKFAKGYIKPFDGLIDLLNLLKADGFKMAVASSGTPENVGLITEECGLKEFFSALVYGNQVQHSKPHPDIFLLASKKLGVSPSGCIVVEDAPVGVEGAKKAGMKCIGVSSTHKRDFLKSADIVIDNYNNLSAEIFNKLINPAT